MPCDDRTKIICNCPVGHIFILDKAWFLMNKSKTYHPGAWYDLECSQCEDEPKKKLVDKWDDRFLKLAKHISSWSKDPSTQAGAVIVDEDKRIISTGYNGFPKGVLDSPERYNDREIKYKMVVHAERNAIIFAQRSLKNCTLYTVPFQPCAVCANMVIQSGIKRCVAPPLQPHLQERWGEDIKIAQQMFKEAGVVLDIIEME